MRIPARTIGRFCISAGLTAIVSPFVCAVAPVGVSVESRDWLCVGFSGEVARAALTQPSNYAITSPGDANYATPRAPLAVGRRSQLLQFPEFPNYSLRSTNGHWAYLQLPESLTSGHSYSVTVHNVNGPAATVGLWYDDQSTPNHNIKVNQVGYQPASPAKFGYLGGFLGDAGELPLGFAVTAYVCSAANHAVAAAVPVTLRAAANKVYGNPVYVEREMTGESVYEFEFSELTNSGSYYVRVPGLGCSYPFRIAEDVHHAVFTNVAHALYLQRCGIAVGPADSAFFNHGRCHTQAMELTTSSNADTFIAVGSGIGTYQTAVGGWHDAGDYDRRVYHLDPVRRILDTYMILSNRCRDGDAPIPERTNGIPDLLDEAWWGLKVWFDLQDSDGGIRGGTERQYEGGMTEPVDDPKLDYYVFAKDMVNRSGTPLPSAAWCAAAAAQMARLLLPWDAARAQLALERARLAYDYAATKSTSGGDFSDAAAELYCTTGEDVYWQAFLASGARQSFALALGVMPGMDAAVRNACRAYWLTKAGDAVIAVQGYNSYRCARSSYRPIRFGGGSGGHITAHDLCKGHALSGSAAYLAALRHDVNFVLGCNPLGRSWITGVGALTPEKYLHRQWIIDGRGEIPPGYHIYGPFAKSDNRDSYGTHYETFWTNLYPETTSYPRMRAYTASEWMAGMNEFTVQETIVPSYCNFAYLDCIGRTPAEPPARAPGILVLAPGRGSAVAHELVEARVRADAARGVAEVRIAGAVVSGECFYSSDIVLHEGSNTLQAIAVDTYGLATTTEWDVVCTIAEPGAGLAAAALPVLAHALRRRP